MTAPLISCVMPTTGARRWCIPLAIRCFQRQSYPNKELVIVGDGDDPIADLVPADSPRIRYVHLPERIALSDKYNACVEAARADWIALWADDDWHSPRRLSVSMAETHALIEIVGLRKMIFHRLGTSGTWTYEKRGPDPYFLGGSILFRRRYWERHPFASGKERQADSDFTNAISAEEYARVAAVLDDPRIYVAMNHGDNTGRDGSADMSGLGWSEWPEALENLMGHDLQHYTRAFLSGACP